MKVIMTMNTIPANLGVTEWNHNGRSSTFTPNGRVLLIGSLSPATPNPVLWSSDEPMLSARLFVNLHAGDQSRTIDDVIAVARRVRVAQSHDPDASFLAQKGIHTSRAGRKTTVTDVVQIVIINVDGEPLDGFSEEAINLAEVLATEMDQEDITVEIQEGGVSKRTLVVTPDKQPNEDTGARVRSTSHSISSKRHSLNDATLEEFANRVLDVADSLPCWSDSGKVFISHVWGHLSDSGETHGLSRADFGKKLFAAHQKQLLTLTRADLVEAMPRNDVIESLVPALDGNVTFHFIRTRGGCLR